MKQRKTVWPVGWSGGGGGHKEWACTPSHHRGYHTEWFQLSGSLGNVQTHLWLEECYWTWQMKGRDATRHPSVCRMASAAKNDLAPNINSAEIETIT